MVRQFTIGAVYCANEHGLEDEEMMWDHVNRTYKFVNMSGSFLCVSKFVEGNNALVMFLGPDLSLVDILESHGNVVGDHLFWDKMFE